MQQTEGETDSERGDDSEAPPLKPTPSGRNLFGPEDEKWNTKAMRDEARDMKRQLRHYITESNMHDVHGLPQMLNISPSDLESGAETMDPDAHDNSTMNLLFPTRGRKTHGGGGNVSSSSVGGTKRVEAESVREKLDSVQLNVNHLIESLETEKKKIKDKKLLQFLSSVESQLSGLQDNVEDAEIELKAEEEKYQGITKEYEKASKKYQALKEKQEREEREKHEKIIKEQEKKLKEQQQLIVKWQQMAMSSTPMGPTPQGATPMGMAALNTINTMSPQQAFAMGVQSGISPRGTPRAGAVPSGTISGAASNTAVLGNNSSSNPAVAMSPRLEAIPQAASVYSDDGTVQINPNVNDEHNDTAMPLSQMVGSHPHSPQTRARDKSKSTVHRQGTNQSRSLSRKTGSKHNRYTSHSNDSGGGLRFAEAPHISEFASDEDLFAKRFSPHVGTMHNVNNNVDTGHRSSNEMEEAPMQRQSSNHGSHHSHQSHNQNLSPSHRYGNNNNNNNINIAQQQALNMPISVSSGSRANSSVPNNNLIEVPLNTSNNGRYGYPSPQPGFDAQTNILQSEGPGYVNYEMYNQNNPIVRYPDSMQIDNNMNNINNMNNMNSMNNLNNVNNNMYNNQNQQQYMNQRVESRPLISDTGVKIIAGAVVLLASIWIISKITGKNSNSGIPPPSARRPPRPRGF